MLALPRLQVCAWLTVIAEGFAVRVRYDPHLKGPFASSVGIGRAEKEFADLNRVKGLCGSDTFAGARADPEAPMAVPAEVTSSNLSNLPTEFDLVIVGAGLSGAVFAERASKELGLTSLVIDKRHHVGGNVYDYVNEHGIRVSKYGAHLFHTKHERVWDYMQQFSEWIPFDHRVRGMVPDKEGVKRLVPIPPTMETINTLLGENIKSEGEMEGWYEKVRVKPVNGEARNGEEAALSRVGPQLYECIFKHYTKKQWDKYPAELDASVLNRLPCRTSRDDRYFTDPYQAIPRNGYTRIFENMLLRDPNITVRLNVDFFAAKKAGNLPRHGELLVYTGPIDAYFAELNMEKLEYRSLRFEEEFVKDPEGGFFQEAMVVNHPAPDVNFTRVVEYKHLPNQPKAVLAGKVKGTTIVREYSSALGDPYYPVMNKRNQELFNEYKRRADAEKDISFVGRLASYKYFNMDDAVLNALEMFDDLKRKGKLRPKSALGSRRNKQ